MASELRVNTLKDASGNNSIATSFVAGGSAKAWFIFDMVNSNTLDDTLNIASATDRGDGSMYGNYTSSMSAITHVCTAADSPVAAGSMGTTNTNRSTISSADTSSRCSINIFQSNSPSTFHNDQTVQGLVHGDLA